MFLPSGTPPGSLEPTPSPSSTTCPPLPTPPITNCNELLPSFDPDPADVALSSVPGQEAFDPRRHRFSEEELKPQPMIKKARKMLVPDDLKVRSSTQHHFMDIIHIIYQIYLCGLIEILRELQVEHVHNLASCDGSCGFCETCTFLL